LGSRRRTSRNYRQTKHRTLVSITGRGRGRKPSVGPGEPLRPSRNLPLGRCGTYCSDDSRNGSTQSTRRNCTEQQRGGQGMADTAPAQHDSFGWSSVARGPVRIDPEVVDRQDAAPEVVECGRKVARLSPTRRLRRPSVVVGPDSRSARRRPTRTLSTSRRSS
jgi:hypothetical protein